MVSSKITLKPHSVTLNSIAILVTIPLSLLFIIQSIHFPTLTQASLLSNPAKPVPWKSPGGPLATPAGDEEEEIEEEDEQEEREEPGIDQERLKAFNVSYLKSETASGDSLFRG